MTLPGAAPARPRTLVLVVAPSLGSLDSWLPVVSANRDRDPDTRIVAVVPERRTIVAVDPDDTMVRLADGLVDSVLAPTVDGGWVRADGFVAARDLVGRERLASGVARVLGALSRRFLGRRPLVGTPPRTRAILRALRPRATRRADVRLAEHIGAGAMVCYDVHVHRHPASAAVLAELGDLPRASLHHGIDLVRDDGRRFPLVRADLDVAVGLFSELERPAYRSVHGLDDAVLHVVGIPRHDREWMERVIAASRERHLVPVEDAVFVISRPAGSTYLPDERKVAALAALHRVVCEERGIPLVIKLHPKERDDGTLARGLPTSGEGRSWYRVRAHPFHIAQHALAAVAFHSGVLIDMVALGVPAIELIDVRGLVEHDRPGTQRDARGRPMHSALRAHGLVLPADDGDDLAVALDGILTDRVDAVARLRRAYDATFPAPGSAIAAMLGAMTGSRGVAAS